MKTWILGGALVLSGCHAHFVDERSPDAQVAPPDAQGAPPDAATTAGADGGTADGMADGALGGDAR